MIFMEHNMEDITLCINDSCPLLERCLRHLSHHKNYGLQSYSRFNSLNEDDCEFFVPKFKQKQRLRKLKSK